MSDLPATIGYDSSLDDVRRALDAGGVIWVVNSDYGNVELLYGDWMHETHLGKTGGVSYSSGKPGSYSGKPAMGWAAVRMLNASAHFYVEYPTSAGGDHAVH